MLLTDIAHLTALVHVHTNFVIARCVAEAGRTLAAVRANCVDAFGVVGTWL